MATSKSKKSHFTLWQWVAILLIIALVLNIILVTLKILSSLWFWIIILIIGIIAYKGIPRWSKR